VSELRRVHRGATNISITEIEWRNDGEAGAGEHERKADSGGPHGGLLGSMIM
jgi:hypothetical protein